MTTTLTVSYEAEIEGEVPDGMKIVYVGGPKGIGVLRIYDEDNNATAIYDRLWTVVNNLMREMNKLDPTYASTTYLEAVDKNA